MSMSASTTGKASAAIRRSGVRLRSTLGGGHTPLKLTISEQSSVRQKYKDLVSAQSSAIQTQERWSQAEESPAIQDILHQVYELNLMWAETQREFIVALKEYKRVYEHILQMEKKLDQAKKHQAACEERERKLTKELVKGPKEPVVVQDKLRQATDAKELADAEVAGQQRETEAVKLMSLRAGLLDHSRAWNTLGRKCCILAESQKELAQLIPDVNTRVQELPSYTSNRESTRVLYSARSQLEHMDPPPYGATLASYPPSGISSTSSSRPSSARRYSDSSSPPPYPGTQDSISTSRSHPQLLGTIDQEYDSFDSFESD